MAGAPLKGKPVQFDAVIVAAGRGSRAGGAKQWRLLAGKPLARWSLEALLRAGVRWVSVVVPPGDEAQAARAFAGLDRWSAIGGGAERFDSVRAGLDALPSPAAPTVLIHDAARPFLDQQIIESLRAALDGAEGAIPALPMVDTLKRRSAEGAFTTTDREGLIRAQTPQAFRVAALKSAIEAWPTGETPTDDAQVLERAGGRVSVVPGDGRLMKLTYPEDFAMAEALAGGARQICVGHGYDVHRFGPGDHLWLCGVRIDHSATLIGHSDADAGLHALVDALLGAISAGDIGDHFPPSDERWRGVASSAFVSHAARLVAERGGRITNVDVTLICEQPKIKPHREAMRARIAELLTIAAERVSVKATTTEGLGFTGSGEGLAAQAVASVALPF